MGILGPLVFAYNTFNTAANCYLAGQIGWWGYKKIRELHKEKLRAHELKVRFAEEYKKQYGVNPTPELLSMALRSYNAVERPIQEQLKSCIGLGSKK